METVGQCNLYEMKDGIEALGHSPFSKMKSQELALTSSKFYKNTGN